MQDAGWQRFDWGVGGSKTKHIGIADRFRAHSCAQCVTDNATDAGIGTAVRFQCGRAIVSFHFKRDAGFVVEFHDAGVIFEYRYTPIVICQLFADRLRGRKDGFFQHVIEMQSL